MKILIIGGSRFMGPRIVNLLMAHGHNLTVFNRGTIIEPPPGAKFIKGDRDLGFKITDHFDAAIDTCAYNGQQVAGVFRELKFDFYLHIGTAASYRKPERFPLVEEMPIGDWPLWGDYNKGKVEAERTLEKIGRSYVVLRPVYILGVANHVARERFIYSKIKQGEKIILPGDGKAKAQFVFVQDVAAAVVLLVENKISGIFNCAGDEIITLHQLVSEMAKVVGREARLGFNPATTGVNWRSEEFPFANQDFYCLNTKIKRLGLRFTPLLAGLKADYENYYRGIV